MDKKHVVFIGILLLIIVCLLIALIWQVQNIRAIEGAMQTSLRVIDGLREKINIWKLS